MSSTSNRFPTSGVPISAPTTPAYTTRSHKPSSEGPPPVTPQRIPRAQRHHHQLQNYFRSPLTPASTLSTPYTPLSFHSYRSKSERALATGAADMAEHNSRHDTKLGIGCISPQRKTGGSRTTAETRYRWNKRADETVTDPHHSQRQVGDKKSDYYRSHTAQQIEAR